MSETKGIRSLVVTLILILSILAMGSTVVALSPSISRSYQYQGSIRPGSLISLKKGSSNVVVSSNSNSLTRFVGVAEATNEALLEVNNTANTIQVATSGDVETLVSTLNGPINIGDQVGISPFNGVGMKTIAGDSYIGIARANFNAYTAQATPEQVKDNKGQAQTILVGTIPVSLAVGSSNSTPMQSRFQKDAEFILGHQVSITKLIIALVVAIIALASITSLIYASIYSTIISIGRNPLAKYEIMRSLLTVLGMVVLIGAVSSISIYLLVK